jgi:hypothetical protein
MTMTIYFATCYVEKISVKKVLFEYSSFFLLFFFWTNFIIYKTAFLRNGFSIISGNAPYDTIMQYSRIDITQTFLSIGIITSILGIYTVYQYIAGKRKKDVIVFISLFFSAMALLFTGLTELDLTMALLSLSLLILSSQAISDIFGIIDKSKIAAHARTIFIVSMAIIMAAQGIPGIFAVPGIISKAPKEQYVSDLLWIRDNTPVGSVIAATVEEGNLISYYSQRKNIADTNYLLADDPKERLSDIDKIFRTSLKVDAIAALDKYGSDYIMLSDMAKKDYNIDSLKYIDDNCFNIVLDSYIKVYKKSTECRVKSYEN